MNKPHENKFTMYVTVDKTFDKYAAHVTLNPALSDSAAEFKDLIAAIDAERRVQDRDDTGVAMDKEEALKRLVLVTMKVSGGLVAHATKTRNHTLAEQARLVESDLYKLRDTAIPDRCTEILLLCNGIEAMLDYHGVTATVRTQLLGEIENYRLLMTAPRNASTERSTAGSKLHDNFSKADLMLKDVLDKLMKQFEDAHPKFHGEYLKARMIIDLGVHSKKDKDGTDVDVDDPTTGK